jgi:hypothetical protein
MSFTTKTRYPTCPKGFTKEQEQAWNTLVRALEQRDYSIQVGPPEAWSVETLKNGVLAKGYTTITSDFYCQTSTGTMLVDTSSGNVNIYLTTAADSNHYFVRVKKIHASNQVLVHAVGSVSIDNVFTVTVSAHNDSMSFGCDGKQWYTFNRH